MNKGREVRNIQNENPKPFRKTISRETEREGHFVPVTGEWLVLG